MDLKSTIVGNEAFVFLNVKELSLEYSTLITNQIYEYASQGKQVTLKINCGGGSVLGGWNIVDALVETKSNTHIIGLAASMAGVISQYGKKRKASPNAILHIHEVSGGTPETSMMSKSSIIDVYKTKSKFSEDQIDGFMSDGKEHFFNAGDMKTYGLVDEVVGDTEQLVETVENKSTEELFQIFNSIITDSEMDNEVKNELKAIRQEKDQLVNKIEGLENSNKTLGEENESLKNDNTALKEQVDTANKAKAEALINSAVKAGKVKEEEKEGFVKDAIENYELVAKFIDMIENASTTIEDLVNVTEGQKSFKDMTDEEKGALAREKPEMYNKLIMA
jgi:ATP-dependent Clp protease, protease subunit